MAAAEPDTARTKPRSRLLMVTATVALWLNVGLFALLVLPLVGGIAFFHIWYLWLYVGAAAAGLAFVAFWLVGRALLSSIRQRLQLAFLSAAIAFAAVGIALMASIIFVRGYRVQMAGYWLHAKIWLDVEQVRQWAQTMDPPKATLGNIELRRFPTTSWLTGFPAGRVLVDRRTQEVRVIQGSALSGHWGVFVTTKDRQRPEDDESTNTYYWKLEDGAWVWCSEH